MSVSILNTDASLQGKTLQVLENDQTVSGLHTYDRGASAPFAVVPGAAKVSNLDADKLDGEEGSAFHNAQLLTGVLPASVIGTDPDADRVAFWDDSQSAFKYLELVGLMIRGTQLQLHRGVPQGRLTLTSATPVTSGDVTAATTLYYALHHGNQVPLFNGTEWENFEIAELSIAVPGTMNTMYDVFIDYNSGTPALALTAWTNDTTRATALTKQDGYSVLTGTLGKLYVGSFRTTGVSGQTEDSLTKRYVWNKYNRDLRHMRLLEATNSWNYNGAAIRQLNGAAANQLDLVCGEVEDMASFQILLRGSNNTGGAFFACMIGEDSTTAKHANCLSAQVNPGASVVVTLSSFLNVKPAIGRHVYVPLEYADATITTSFYGDNGGTIDQSGIVGLWRA